MRYDAFKRFTKRFIQRGALVPRFPLTRTLGPLGVTAKVASNWWLAGGISASNAVAAYAPKGAASYAASKVNLANPGTYDATEGAAPTWAAATGWTFNGTTQYLTSTAGWSGTYSLIVRFANAGSATSGSSAIGGGGGGLRIHSNYFGPHAYQNGSNVRFTGSSVASGVMAIAGVKGYLDGTNDVTNLDGTASGTPVYIACTAPGSGLWRGDILALALYNTTLTAAQVAAVSSAMAAL